MKAIIKNATVFSIDEGTSKNGYFANIIILNMEDRAKIEIFSKDQEKVKRFKAMEINGEVTDIEIDVNQNKFGIMVAI